MAVRERHAPRRRHRRCPARHNSKTTSAPATLSVTILVAPPALFFGIRNTMPRPTAATCTAALSLAAAAAGAGPTAVGASAAASDLGTQLSAFFEAADGDVNTLFSALSIETCFSLVYPGAAGTTASEIASTLGFNAALSGEAVFSEYQSLEATLEAAYDGSNITGRYSDEPIGQRPLFKGANKIYVDDDFTLTQSYASIVSDLVQTLNLAGAGAADLINEWCSNATNGLIDDVVDDSVADAVLVAVNAIYLNATWTHKFEDRHTFQGTFYARPGDGADVVAMDTAFMHQIGDFAHAVFGGHDLVQLPYQDSDLSMVVAIPRSASATDVTESQLLEALATTGSFTSESVALGLPRFSYRGSYVLNEALEDLGMQDAFNPQAADFSNMSTTDVYISKVIHKTFINVWEEGTEAAAVTAILIEATSLREPETPVLVLADSPFQFFIYDAGTETVLFNGKVFNPESDQAAPSVTASLHTECDFWKQVGGANQPCPLTVQDDINGAGIGATLAAAPTVAAVAAVASRLLAR